MKPKNNLSFGIGSILAYIGLFIFGLGFQGNTLKAQQILLDKLVQAGELKLFPTLEDPNKYYYLADKINIARHNDGTPQFLFLKYVKNEESQGAGSSTITESTQAGGIIHAVVTLEVPDEMLTKARQALRRYNSSGEIVGPVMYKSGTIAIISSVANKNGDQTQKVVGIGTAPILEGQKAAVSVQLNKEGSDILWATFQTPTPDFSVSFEMEVEGYLSPKRVKIEADFDRMYKNSTFEAALASPILAGEIKATFDELKDQGAIKVTQVGEDEGLNKIMETAYNKLTNLMFDKIGGTGVPQLTQLMGNNNSMLDRATSMLDKARREARAENQRAENRARNQNNGSNNSSANNSSANNSSSNNSSSNNSSSNNSSSNNSSSNNTAASTNVASTDTTRSDSSATQPGDSTQSQTASTSTGNENTSSEPSNSGSNNGSNSNSNNNTTRNNTNSNAVTQQAVPSMSVALSYRMKRVKRSGKYVIDLNKYTSDTRTMRFDENLGMVKSCRECFERVNLDDPLYKQRDIHARIDGLNAQDFGSYINFVNVLMRKKHQNGEETVKEIRVDKTLFNKEGNDFVMQYGWKGDDNRSKWLEYEYMTRWSFFGDIQIETEWQRDVFSGMALAPPLVKKPIYIEADPDFFKEEGIRAAEVNISYTVNGKTITKKARIKSAGNQLSQTVDVFLPLDSDTYTYQITWFKKGERPIQSEAEESNYGSIYLDYIP